jgi:MarR family transcriptional regulator, 2-MHQ and catechol-resistance regulon repressor
LAEGRPIMAGRLQRELKKRRPFELLEEEATLNLMRTSDRVQIQFSRLFREHGLTSSQYNILRILRGEGKPLPCLEIADRMIAVVPGITGLIDRLEAMALVCRERSADDRRVVFITIEEKALRVLDKLEEPVKALNKKLLNHMSHSELKELIRLLEKARQPPQPETAESGA